LNAFDAPDCQGKKLHKTQLYFHQMGFS